MGTEVKNDPAGQQWDQLLLQIKDVYTRLEAMDTSDIPSSDKITGWENFLNSDAVRIDNPHSDEDDLIRKKIKERIEFWRRIETQTSAGLNEESNKQPEINAAANTGWQKEILANEYLSNAKKYLENGDYNKADACFEKFMSLGRDLSPDEYYLRSAIQVGKGNYEGAVKTLSDYLAKTGRASYKGELATLSGDEQVKETEERRKEIEHLRSEADDCREEAKNALMAYLEQLKCREGVYREELELLSAGEKEAHKEKRADYEKEEMPHKPEEKNRIEDAKKMLITYLKQKEQKPKAYQEVLDLLLNEDKD
ncbi:MAG: hypothetical protein FJ264_00090 [Planctomycetes bacterium]|nr:hypothetical protein [Planctomycetota bacterium]